MVLDIAGGGQDNGTNLIQNTPDQSAGQQWTVTAVDDGVYKIINVMNKKAIDVAELSTANGGNVHVWDYVDGDNQKWRIENGNQDYRLVINKLSGLSLDADDWSTEPGGNVIQWQAGDAQANQLWRFEIAD